MSTRMILIGAKGRLGTAILDLAAESNEVEVRSAVTRPESESVGQEHHGHQLLDLSTVDSKWINVVVDVSLGEAVSTHLEWAITHKVPFICGATGISGDTLQMLEEASEAIPVLLAPNFSPGSSIQQIGVMSIAPSLKSLNFNANIVEAHNATKLDTPSATALQLKELLQLVGDHAAIHSIRSGTALGEHRVIFGGNGEEIEITHRITDLSVFARGALEAARFIAHKEPGLYGMGHVVESVSLAEEDMMANL